MDFRILGPLEIAADGGSLAVGGAKQRALLAMLLLNSGAVVSSDRLVDALWGDEPPETAPKALQVHVSQLRKTLGAALIRTRPSGYGLELGDHGLDLERFRRLQDEARSVAGSDPARARRLLTDALALWRGPPLADFTYEPFARSDIRRLEEMRIAAIEDRVDADLALGRHGEVVGELESLIAEHPLRERLRAQRMLALYRSGRQAEALDAYHAARRALNDELGIEPGRELQRLQQAILGQDPELDLATAAELTAAEPAHGALVGRDDELRSLVSAAAGRARGARPPRSRERGARHRQEPARR